MYAAAVGGAQGVHHAITLLRDEVDRNMAMLGATSMAEITPTACARRGPETAQPLR
jgi:L-lactate dehydrogenase (cytochrome)